MWEQQNNRLEAAAKLRAKERADGYKMPEHDIQKEVEAQYPIRGHEALMTEEKAREFQRSRVGAPLNHVL